MIIIEINGVDENINYAPFFQIVVIGQVFQILKKSQYMSVVVLGLFT